MIEFHQEGMLGQGHGSAAIGCVCVTGVQACVFIGTQEHVCKLG